MKIEKNTAEGQTSVAREATNVVMTPEDKSEETLSGRVLSQSARAAALAYDEVFKLKHELAIAQQPERDRIAPQVHALQEQISDLTAQLEATRAALFEHRLQKKFIQQRDRADALQSYNDEILASTSWRVTSPLRRVSLTLRRVKSVVCR
ncbi:MAG: hypothetical protein ACI9U6_000093 [Loktanella salsilacus]|jgi:hypothetical protein|uniref:hypothetical protein n=1 Tax=Loktanella salsilacus TaxID=195913 RepID=UPI003988D53F